jgi:hypothetical protein
MGRHRGQIGRRDRRRIDVKAAGYLLAILGCAVLYLAAAFHSSFHPAGVAAIAGNGAASLISGIGCVVVAVRRDRREAEVARVTAIGLAGTGTIGSIELTQATAKPICRVQVHVTLADGPAYQATVTRPIARSDLPRYQPGCAFPVRVDPADLSAIVLVDSVGMTWASGAAGMTQSVPGTATVAGHFDAVAAGVEAAVWGVLLRVRAADGRPPYDVRLSAVRPDGLRRPRRGDRLAVQIDSADPRRIAVDWASLAGQPPGIGHRRRAVSR